MYKHIFGPVPSRRLGMSLGVDMVPHKVCTFNCVYCECGETTKLIRERKEYVLYDKVINELEHYIHHHPPPEYFTFSGAGEPTLNIRIGDVITFIKSYYPDIPVAVLTNGSLLSDKQVRKELQQADLILPSLDAANDATFQKIDRPVPGMKISDIIQGLEDFRKEYSGQIRLEVMIIPGYNDDPENLDLLKQAVLKIKPDQVQLNSLDRPGTMDDISAATVEQLEGIVKFWKLPNVEIIASGANRKKQQSYRADTESAIMETIARRPCTVDDLARILGMHVNEINKYLDVLEADKKVKAVREKRGVFYQKTPE